MSSEIDDFTRKLLERTRARQEAMQMKKMEQVTQSRKRRPLEEAQDNITVEQTLPTKLSAGADCATGNENESPNKRSRIESDADVENQPSSVADIHQEAHVAKQGQARQLSVGERMRKIANQRLQWEAADHGESVDFSDVLSPVRHDPSSPRPSATLQRKIDVDRKARLAALSDKVNSWEDDLTRTKLSPDPDEAKRQHVARRTPWGGADQAEVQGYEDQAETSLAPPPAENVRPSKQISQRVSLSIETLSQFAGKDKKPQHKQQPAANQGTPVIIPAKIQGKLGGNRITVASCRNDESCLEKVPSHQVTPTTKSLQQRLIELQKHGCKAEPASSSVRGSIAVRQRELDALKTSPQPDEAAKDTETDEEECMAVSNSADSSIVSESKEDGRPLTPDDDTSLRDDSKRDDDESIEEASCLSYGDSMMEDDDCTKTEGSAESLAGPDFERFGDEHMLCLEDSMSEMKVVEEEVQTKESGEEEESKDNGKREDTGSLFDEQERAEQDESHGDEDAMIDELFEGVDSAEDDEEGENLVPRSNSPLTLIPSLTRQKSKLEIKSELTVRKQTCNEAEDTHVIRRQPSRRLRPLARSNSSESVRSNEEQPGTASFPLFTIDAYRNEKRKSMRKPNEKKVVRKENVKNLTAHKPVSVERQIAAMTADVQQQQRVIQQASAALNCCYDAQHGKGSITEVEAEKLLLIASEKRLALLGAIQDLKAGKVKTPTNQLAPCNGSITIDRIQLMLRTEYILSLANKKDGGDARNHYFFVLVKCGARRVFASRLVTSRDSISGDSLVFQDKFEFDNLDSDFEICIEVYSKNKKYRPDGVPNQEKSKGKFSGILHKLKVSAVQQRRSRHVTGVARGLVSKRKAGSSVESLTPRKPKNRPHALLPQAASPGGPNAIRISDFSLIGSTSLTLDDVNKDKFALMKVPFMSPISGKLGCRIITNFKSGVEQRGFLTLFDDVGGLGAWHRRWCALIHGVLYSWTYPDDEKRKTPLSKVQLKECISDSIRTVERIRCARPNTFELRTMRPRRHGDRDNLISQDTGSVITTKHWLAADTKEERVAWIDGLNQALADVRAWEKDALKPLHNK